MTVPHVIVVVKRTAYGRYVEEERDERIARLIASDDPTVHTMRHSHEEHEQTVAEVKDALDALQARTTWVRRSHGQFEADDANLVVTVGGDGTLLAASHRVKSTPILGVNSSPAYSVGFFCGAASGDFRTVLVRALSGRERPTALARMSVAHGGKVISSRVLNDALFCHRSPAATSRYLVRYRGTDEEHKSSGFWIGPAAGSTAAQRSAGGRVLPLGSHKLQFIVREPYTPVGDRLRLARVLVGEGEELVVRSKMPEAFLFLDGPYESVRVELGDQLVFRRSREPLRVIGLTRPKGWSAGRSRRPPPGH